MSSTIHLEAVEVSTEANTLVITPEAYLFGQSDIYVGKCGTIDAAIAFCAAAGWNYRLAKKLTQSQQDALKEYRERLRRLRGPGARSVLEPEIGA
jgi:hypothetical protein